MNGVPINLWRIIDVLSNPKIRIMNNRKRNREQWLKNNINRGLGRPRAFW